MTDTGTSRVHKRATVVAITAIVVWAIVLIGGFGAIRAYSERPGERTAPPARWPASSGIARSTTRPTLVMILHPHCVCSRASLAELERLLQRSDRNADAVIVVARPPHAPEGWERGANWTRVQSMPGVRVVLDRNAVEARRFGAATSGSTLLYDETGRLLFHGGITASRGHEGPNRGADAVVALLARRSRGPAASTSVFGCPLQKPTKETPQCSDHS